MALALPVKKKTRCHVQTNKGAFVPSILPSLKELKVHPLGAWFEKKQAHLFFVWLILVRKKMELTSSMSPVTYDIHRLIPLFVICAKLKKQSGDLG